MRQRFYVWLWRRLPVEEREAFVGGWISHRARRRAAMSPFPRTFEDEVNNAGVDMVRDLSRVAYGDR